MVTRQPRGHLSRSLAINLRVATLWTDAHCEFCRVARPLAVSRQIALENARNSALMKTLLNGHVLSPGNLESKAVPLAQVTHSGLRAL